jgi:hypothetical protein
VLVVAPCPLNAMMVVCFDILNLNREDLPGLIPSIQPTTFLFFPLCLPLENLTFVSLYRQSKILIDSNKVRKRKKNFPLCISLMLWKQFGKFLFVTKISFVIP